MNDLTSKTSSDKPLGADAPWSFSTLDQARVQQLLVIFSATAILVTTGFIVISMIAAGIYPFGVLAIVDAVTFTGLGLAILLAFRKQAPKLQVLLVCLSIPANLVTEIVMHGAGAWIGLLLLGLSPFMFGLFAPIWLSVIYTLGLVVFTNVYLLETPDVTVLFAGRDETFLTSIALSVIVLGSALAAILPKKVTGAAYKSMNRVAHKESILKERFAHYATMSSDWHFEIDTNGIVTDFFGTGDAVGQHWKSLLFDWENQADTFRAAVKTRSTFDAINANLRIGEVTRRVECTGQPIVDADGSFAGYRVIAHDITEKAEAEEKLKVLAMSDRLTGLKNRHAFTASLEAGNTHAECAETLVICIDLDNFKHLNDRQGHEAGDTALKELGARFRAFEDAIPGLEVFRLGGDEFCALLKISRDPIRLGWLADQFATAISRPIKIHDRLIDMAASIGAASTKASTTLSAALERADAAVYEAKSLGGGQSIVCEEDIQQRLDRRLAIRRDLSAAIQSGAIEMVYQPIFEVRTGELSGVEALARWTHPEYGPISPDEFITIAESSRAIVALGQHTLRLACTEALDWMTARNETLRLNVNVSPMEIMGEDFIDSLLSILDETGFPANLLELEITERGILEDLDVSRARLKTIRESGVTVALDDFGTGYSSLSRLESLPVDRIKVDRSFFAQAGENRRTQQLLALMSGIGSIMEVDIVAEGIETEDQLRLVRLAGFSKVQGYLLGRPGNLDELHASAESRARTIGLVEHRV